MKQFFLYPPLLGFGLALLASQPARPSAPPAKPAADPAAVRFFESKVRPLLAAKCYACHGPQKQTAGLRLDGRAAILQGGDSGAAVVPGHPEKSLLIEIVDPKTGRMPPSGKLKPQEVEVLVQWVKLGAPWGPEAGAASARPQNDFRNPKSAAARSWWAFQPVRRPPVPQVADRGWSRNVIDRFVYARLQKEGLSPAPEADPATLIRRVYFDLVGLPPSPEEVDAFVKECAAESNGQRPVVGGQPAAVSSSATTAGAYERLVDRLLASPRYGERWARHWLDLVRYADSDGYRADEYRPNAWHYRDYVIRSLNQDKPYHRFVKEQLAGDELYPGDPEALIATGYLRHWIYEWNQRDVRGQWNTILDDLTDTTGDVFFGMGIQCARCHDHKFDPILQKDYFRLRAFFAPILPRDDMLAATEAEKREYQAKLAVWERKTAAIRSQIEEIEGRYKPKAAEGAIRMFPPDIQEMIYKPVAKRAPLEHQLAELAYRQVLYEFDRIDTRIKGEDKEKLLALRKQLAAFEKEKPAPLPVAFAATDLGPQAPPVFIPKKGKEPVEPGFLTVLDERPAVITPLPDVPNSTGRRAALARWLTRPDNPLTGRVIVNRVWGWHFGKGLAANASDFGKLGEAPTHPELLDYLAHWFTSDGEWSFKRLHRLIVTSSTYRQATRHPEARAYALKDPENRLYWRADTRRLQAEQIRDAILAVTGELDLKEGGPGVVGTQPRRTIYNRFMRNTRDPLLDVFDLPQFFTSASSRDTTTTPVQSLMLFNSQLMLLRARALADRLEREAPGSESRLIDRAFRLVFGRAPTSAEVADSQQFLVEQARRINVKEAGTEAAAFLYDKIPYRDGQAAVFAPDGPQKRFEVPDNPMLPSGDFTIEAFVLPRSVYESAAVRTIVSKWDGSMQSPGWGFGITGKQSRRKPQTLVLQIIGRKLDGSFGEEAIFSDQHIQINKPYYVSAAVKLAKDGKPGTVTFRVKDLSNDDEPLLTAEVSHRITGEFTNRLPLVLGGRPNSDAYFHGLIDDVRLSNAALDVNRLLYTAEGTNQNTVAYWQFEPKPDVFHDSAGHKLNIRPASSNTREVDPRRAALEDFCHVLLNSSEFLYVD